MFIKIWYTFIFLLALTASLFLSSIITINIGKSYFGLFVAGCQKDMVCLMQPEIIRISDYPYNLLFALFILLNIIFMSGFTYLILRYIVKNK